MNRHPVLLPGPRLLLSYTEKMGEITATILMTRVVNGACVVATHLQLPLSILLLSTATHLRDEIGLDN